METSSLSNNRVDKQRNTRPAGKTLLLLVCFLLHNGLVGASAALQPSSCAEGDCIVSLFHCADEVSPDTRLKDNSMSGSFKTLRHVSSFITLTDTRGSIKVQIVIRLTAPTSLIPSAPLGACIRNKIQNKSLTM